MASISEAPFTLHGGCNCKALRYTLDVPTLSSRSILWPASMSGGQGDIRLPMFSVDHCNHCRQATGSLTNFWMMAPRSDISFQCLVRDSKEEYIQLSGSQLLFPETASEDTFIVHYKSSHNEGLDADTIRSFCGRCGTTISVGLFPWKLPMVAPVSILMGTLDRECLEMDGVRPERHLCCADGIDWVVKMVSEGDTHLKVARSLPKHLSMNIGEFLQ